ncbi:hypothetical protein KR093_009732 [Drosophila rubida]|uniref:Uncharacterized protein n=1 Tax=Drosophila rubida TaxID=30044 RepID=A0AAD4K8N8_9MUSC|nr:hypothetical protein KR093_009732 [Drosophila rubida]
MCPITISLLLLASLVGLFYIFLIWNFNHWTKQGIKTVKSWPFLGSFPSAMTQKRNVAYDMLDIYNKYKDTENIVGVLNTRSPQLMVLTPEYMRAIYVTEFRKFHDNEMSKFTNEKVDKILANNPFLLLGDKWKERRAEITPGLSPNRVQAVYSVTQTVCKKFIDYIRKQQRMAPSDGLNAKSLCLCYTTEVVADCVLGISAGSFSDTPAPLVSMVKRVFEQSFGFIFFNTLATLWPPIRNFYSVPFFTKDVENFFFDIMQKAVNLRRESSEHRNRADFLNYMLQLQEKKGLDIMMLTSHTMTFLTDGFETTALVLSHTLLELARNPEALRLLREEVGTEELSFDKLSELPYLDACISETLRIFPPGLASRKLVTEPFEFVNKDGVSAKVVPGDVVILPIYAFHHDPNYYDQPEQFQPERFLEQNGGVRKYREQGLFYGWGDGPRVCPGMRFALTQLKAAVVEIVRHFNFKPNPKTRTDNVLDDTYFIGCIKGGIWLDFEPRD